MTLLEKRAEALRKAKALVDGAKIATRELTGAEQGQLDALVDEAHALAHDIHVETADTLKKQAERLDGLEEQLNTPIIGPNRGGHGEKALTFKDAQGFEYKSATGKQRLSDLHGRQEAPFGEIVKSVLTGQWSEHTKTQMLSVDPSAGYFVNQQIQNYTIDLARDASVLSQAGAITLAFPEGVSHSVYIRETGDPAAGWFAEGTQIPPSEASFAPITLITKKCAILVPITREAVETANFAKRIEAICAKALAAEIDRVQLMGSGAGQEPIGLVNTPGVNTITGVADVNYDDILNAIKKVEDSNFKATGGIWSPETAYQLSVLKAVTDGQYLNPPEAYKALPKHVTMKAGDSYAFVGDFSQIGVAVRPGIRMEYGHVASDFAKDQQHLRFIVQLDTICFNPAAFCVLSGLS